MTVAKKYRVYHMWMYLFLNKRSVTEQFLTLTYCILSLTLHWIEVNLRERSSLGPLVLRDGFSIAGLTA